MEYDKNKSVQLLNLMGQDYVLVRKQTYDELLDKLEALDTALVITQSREQASQDVLKAMLKGNFSVEQIREVAKTKTIGERIRLIRKIRKLDQRKLAEKSGLSQTAISNLENDLISEPSFASLDAVFEGLQVPEGAVYPLLKTTK
jgi:DNA-binding XRE family transcriptional regulator